MWFGASVLLSLVYVAYAGASLYAPKFSSLPSTIVPPVVWDVAYAFTDKYNSTLYVVMKHPLILIKYNMSDLTPLEYTRFDGDRRMSCFVTRVNEPCCITAVGDILYLTCFSESSFSIRNGTVKLQKSSRINGDIPTPLVAANGFFLQTAPYEITLYGFDGSVLGTIPTKGFLPTIVYQNDVDNILCIRKTNGVSVFYETYDLKTLNLITTPNDICNNIGQRFEGSSNGKIQFNGRRGIFCGVEYNNQKLATLIYVWGPNNVTFTDLIPYGVPDSMGFNATVGENYCMFISIDYQGKLKQIYYVSDTTTLLTPINPDLTRTFFAYTSITAMQFAGSSSLLFTSYYFPSTFTKPVNQIEVMKTSPQGSIMPYYGDFVDSNYFIAGVTPRYFVAADSNYNDSISILPIRNPLTFFTQVRVPCQSFVQLMSSYSSDMLYILCTKLDGSNLELISVQPSTQTIRRLKIGDGRQVQGAISADGNRIYVRNAASGLLHQIDNNTFTISYVYKSNPVSTYDYLRMSILFERSGYVFMPDLEQPTTMLMKIYMPSNSTMLYSFDGPITFALMDTHFDNLAYLAMSDKLCVFDATTGDYSWCSTKFFESFSTSGTIDAQNLILYAIIGDQTVIVMDISPKLDTLAWVLISLAVMVVLICISLPFQYYLIKFCRKAYIQHVKETELRTLLLDSTIGTASRSSSYLELMGNNVDYIIDLKDLFFVGRLAEGSYGVVFRGVYKGTPVAIKRMKLDHEDDNEDFLREVQILKLLRHPNIVLFMGVCVQEDHKLIVTELMPGGSLETVLKTRKLTFEDKLRLLLDVVRGMVYLHYLDPPMLHRDLKPSNLLLDKNHSIVKVCDFGASRSGISATNMTGNVGTCRYMSPEVLQESDHYDCSSDVYSFAIVMYETFFQKNAYEDTNLSTFRLGIEIINGTRPTLPSASEQEKLYDRHERRFLYLMQQCWSADPRSRPSFEEIRGELESIMLNLG